MDNGNPTNSLVNKLNGSKGQTKGSSSSNKRKAGTTEPNNNTILSNVSELLTNRAESSKQRAVFLSDNLPSSDLLRVGTRREGNPPEPRRNSNDANSDNIESETEAEAGNQESNDDTESENDIDDTTKGITEAVNTHRSLKPMDLFLMSKLQASVTRRSEMKSICRAYGLNPNTPKGIPDHSAEDLITLAKAMTEFRSGELNVYELDEQAFTSLLRFGNIPSNLVDDNNRFGEGGVLLRRWWKPTLKEVADFSPEQLNLLPLAGLKAALGVAGFQVTKSSSNKPSAAANIAAAQGMLATQGFTMRVYPNDHIQLSTEDVLKQATRELLFLIHIALGHNEDAFDEMDLPGAQKIILNTDVAYIDTTVFVPEHTQDMDADDLRVILDLYGYPFAGTKNIGSDDLHHMIPTNLTKQFPYQRNPDYTPPVETSSIRTRMMSWRAQRPPTTPAGRRLTAGTTVPTQGDREGGDDEEYTQQGFWTPTTPTASSPNPTTTPWSRGRLLYALQVAAPRPDGHYETIQTHQMSELFSRMTHPAPAAEHRSGTYNTQPFTTTREDLDKMPRFILTGMLAQAWGITTPNFQTMKPDQDIAQEIWLTLNTARGTPLAGGGLPRGGTHLPQDGTMIAHLRQLERVSETVEKSSETAAKTSRKAEDGTKNVYDNLHNRGFHDLFCDDPATSGASIPLFKLISRVTGGIYVQCSLKSYIELGNSLSNVGYHNFLPLHLVMEHTEARQIAQQVINHRSEKPYPKATTDYTDNNPETWRVIVWTTLNFVGDLLDLGLEYRLVADTIATNVKRFLGKLSDWNAENCLAIVKLAFEQFDIERSRCRVATSAPTQNIATAWSRDPAVHMASSVQYHSRPDAVKVMCTIPYFTNERDIAIKAWMFNCSIVKSMNGTASQFITRYAAPKGGPPTPPAGRSRDLTPIPSDPRGTRRPPRGRVDNPTPRTTVKSQHHCVYHLSEVTTGG